MSYWMLLKVNSASSYVEDQANWAFFIECSKTSSPPSTCPIDSPPMCGQTFDERIGDRDEREVLLAVLWRLRRPSEMRALVDVVRRGIDETPTGLMAREVFAEVVFGPFNFPGADAREAAPALIEIVETHPNGAHRGRLLDSVFGGLDNITTGEQLGARSGGGRCRSSARRRTWSGTSRSCHRMPTSSRRSRPR